MPLNSEAMAVLRQWHQQHKDGRLFHVIGINKAWSRLMADAELVESRFHDLR